MNDVSVNIPGGRHIRRVRPAAAGRQPAAPAGRTLHRLLQMQVLQHNIHRIQYSIY